MLCAGKGLLFAALAALVIGCGEGEGPYFGSARRASRDAETITLNNGPEPEYLDPGRCADMGCATLIAQLFEGLVRRHPDDGRPAQAAAERWEKSDDNRLFRFHLRADGRWSDGAPVVAGDFVYAWKRTLRPRTASRAAGVLDVVLNAEPFRRGLLFALAEARPLLREPRAGAAEGARLDRGAIVRVIERRDGFAKVEPWARLPSFGARPPEEPRSKEQGFVAERDLVEDDGVLGVRARDDHTLEVELERSAPHFLELTSHHGLSPVRRDLVERFEARGEPDLWTRPESMISNGPYTLSGWRFHYDLTMRANPRHRDRDRLRIKRIVWMEVEGYHAAMNLYKAGELDALGDNTPPPAEYVPTLEKKRDFRRYDYLGVYWYELNTRRPPLDDARVRRALDLAIDKRQLVERISRGGQAPATHYVPDFTGSGYAAIAAEDRARGADPFASRGFDPARARALLAEAGYPVIEEAGARRAEKFPAIEILYNTGEGHRLLAVAVQAMWREHLGVAATLRSEEWKVMLKNHRDGNFQVIRLGQIAEYDHPQTFLDLFRASSPQNRTGWSDDRFEAAMSAAARERDLLASARLFREAERVAVEATPRLPLYFYTRSTLVKPWVRGFRPSRHEAHAIQFWWIDPDWERGGPDTLAYPPDDLPPPGRFGP